MAKAQPRARTQCASIKKNPLAFLQRDSALVKDNSVIIALMLLYVAVVTTVLARTQTGQFFLKIEWFDSIALFFGGVFCILCMGIQFFFPKLHPPFRAKNYIQFFIVLLLLSPYRSAFASYKQYISSVAPYSWDKTFMELDKLIHFGHMPWRLLEYLLQNRAILYTIDIIYLLWFVMLIVFSLWMSVTNLSRLRKRYFITAILIWSAFGSGLGTVFYSVGPCYYAAVTGDPGPYGPLIRQLHQAHQENSLLAVRNEQALWQAKTQQHWLPFGGISAMPSVHVAMAVLFALTLGEAFPLLALTGWIFALLIQIGSVVLAWHYAVDGYASALLTWLVWKLLRSAESRRQAATPPSATPARA